MLVNPTNRGYQMTWVSVTTLGWLLATIIFTKLFWPAQIVAYVWYRYFPSLLVWCILNGFISYWVLFYVGHFNSLHPIPERSQIFTVTAILTFAALFSKLLILILFRVEVLRYREIIGIALIPSLLAFTFEYASGVVFIKSGKKRLAFTSLLRPQRKALEDVLRNHGLLDFYELVDSSVLGHALSRPSDIHWVAISRPRVREFVESSPIILAYNLGIPVYDHVSLKNSITGRISTEQYDSWAFLVHATKIGFGQRLYRESKPWIEKLAALFLLIMALPVFLFVGLLVKLADGGPVFYRQKRLGFRGKIFEIVKFRSMSVNAEANGPTWAQSNDPRVTPLGHLLRKSRLDELPQLFNVLMGQMSFIGPRPERPEFHEQLKAQVPHFDLRLLLRPGITGWSQVMGGYAASVDASKQKLEYDLFYLQNMSARIDLVILIRTVFIVLGGQEFKIKKG